jgi:hypothetical protein
MLASSEHLIITGYIKLPRTTCVELATLATSLTLPRHTAGIHKRAVDLDG